jgi:hypothetical protein
MLRATVPEATVYENSHAQFGQNNIGARAVAALKSDEKVVSKSQPLPVKP